MPAGNKPESDTAAAPERESESARAPSSAPTEVEPKKSATAQPEPVLKPAFVSSPSAASSPVLASSGYANKAGSPIAEAASPAVAPDAGEPEISVTPSATLAEIPPTSQPGDSGFTLRAISRMVEVSVTALDHKGRPVPDLTAQNFELYDNGRKQEIKSLSLAAFANPPPAHPAASAMVGNRFFSNRATDPAAGTSEGGGTILLIDDSHLAWNDLSFVRGQMLKFLSAVPSGQPIGLYAMSGLGFRVLQELTEDHGAIAEELKAFLPTAKSVSEAHEEGRRNGQPFATVHNGVDLDSVNGNHGDSPYGVDPVDPELMRMGSNPARAAFLVLTQVARHLAPIAGHKSLVWISSDNVLSDWRDQASGNDRGLAGGESFAVRVAEAMNEAHTAVYPVDAFRLEGGGVTADLQHSSVELNQGTADNAATAPSAGSPGASAGGNQGNRNTGTGRLSAQLSQDIHPIRDIVRDLAAATGGEVVGRTSGLASALAKISTAACFTYELAFVPQGAPDGRYHALNVKLVGRKGVRLRYRTGYLFAVEPANLKERFRDALWRPADASDIGITASVVRSSGPDTIRLNIAAPDLSLRQQDGRWMDKLDIFLVQRDAAGLHAQVDGQTLGLRLLPSTYQKELGAGIPFERTLALRPGVDSIRVLVMDQNSSRFGSVTVPAAALTLQR